MGARIAINGFGRIGRCVFACLIQRKNVEVAAINDLSDVHTLAHLLKYDSIHGRRFSGSIEAVEGALIVDGKKIPVYAEKDPANLPWGVLQVQTVVESTGRFTDQVSAGQHLAAGATRVIISAPAKEKTIPTVVLGVNEGSLSKEARIVSNASCTTNCLAPMAKALDDAFGIEQGYMTTVHAYTSDQRLHDAPHKDLRRARAAALNIIPTSTGAAQALGLVLPHLEGKLDGLAMRVPVANGSITDLTVKMKIPATAKAINEIMRKAAESTMKGIMEYTEDPIVSTDIVGNPHSCIFDALLTACQGTVAKVIGWYDNETGYSNRIADLIERYAR